MELHPARWISLEFAARWLELTSTNDRSVNGPEFGHMVTIHAGPTDVSLGGRLLSKEQENGTEDETLEFTLSVGSTWKI